ncbi:cysteine-rich receptor-like protein kinase 8 [Tanacetum coccineum]|uniref:Cysteine-rich receptor-like protein kinase 8 n=1 Tax=Tanacetum coccineum TaxID=301880 RepID=A0ABQ5AS91_9ASTR
MAPSASSSTAKPTPLALFQNPHYLHPSDGPSSLTLGFVKRIVVRSATDENLVELWDTCNIMVTCWIIVFLAALNKQKEEQRLFQFLNGLEEHFSHQRSQILMIDPLPSVEVDCSLLQQEESQRLLFMSYSSVESSALLSKRIAKDKCSICGFKWHPPEKCWEKVGYPSWHSKYKGPQQSRQSRQGQFQGQNKNQNATRTAAHVESSNISFTPQQFEQLLKNILEGWIYDSGASDHMTPKEDSIFDLYQLKIKPQIKMPNGDSSVISHVGKVKLSNGTILKDVLVVPSFKFSLLSVPKLTQDSQCVVLFYPTFCVVQDLTTRKVTGLGRLKEGLYHLINVLVDKVDSVFSSLVKASLQKISLFALGNTCVNDKYGLWHHRLGHVSDAKLKHMHDLPVSLNKSCSDKCLSCPMAKFTKLPYSLSESHSTTIFELDFVTALLAQQDPMSFKEAILDPEWCVAMDFEIKALDDNDTWELTSLPTGRKSIKHGVDYQETFASVAKMVTLRSLLAVAALKGWDTCQMDVSNAFFHGNLMEEAYIMPPLGYVGKGQKVSAANSLDSTLVYYSLFLKKEGLSITVVLVYVDDLLITGNDQSQIFKLKTHLSSVFHMKDLGELNYFLGLEVCRSSQGIFISQHKYTRELFKEEGVLNNKAYKLPMDPNLKLQVDISTPLSDPEVYRRAIGKLIYLTITRPDICYTVQLLSQFMQPPISIHILGKLSNEKKVNNWILHSFERFSN